MGGWGELIAARRRGLGSGDEVLCFPGELCFFPLDIGVSCCFFRTHTLAFICPPPHQHVSQRFSRWKLDPVSERQRPEDRGSSASGLSPESLREGRVTEEGGWGQMEDVGG